MKRKLLVRSAIGFPLGVVICFVIAGIIGTLGAADGTIHLCSPLLIKAVGGLAPAIVIQAVVSGLFGAVSIGSTAVYEIERWSILKSTAVHFVLSMSMYYITAFSLHWLQPRNVAENLFIFCILIVVYVCIWLVNYFKYKSEVKKINAQLEKIKRTKEEE